MAEDANDRKAATSTQDTRQELLRRMTEIRQALDPKLLERAKLAVFGKVPFDRDAAREAVEHFLGSREDGGAFRRKLEAELRKKGDTPDPDAPPRKPPGSGRSV
jgi:hypothetical protein